MEKGREEEKEGREQRRNPSSYLLLEKNQVSFLADARASIRTFDRAFKIIRARAL